MQFYRDANGTFHRTQAEAKASKLEWSAIDIPTDHKGLCAVLNAIQPPAEFMPQIQALLSGGAVMTTATEDGIQQRYIAPEELYETKTDGLDHSEDHARQLEAYREGQSTGTFMKSRDPLAIFTCTNCGKSNSNQAKRTDGPI